MGKYTPVDYTAWLQIIGNIVTANLVITDEFGNPIQPNFRVGGVFYTLEQIFALCFDALEQRLGRVDSAHRLPSAEGTDLDEFGTLMNKKRTGNIQAQVPVKYSRTNATGPAITIPTGTIILARDKAGNNTIQLTAAQDPTQADGVSAILPLNTGSVWGWATAVDPGAAGNIAAGTVAAISATGISGIDNVSNPPLENAPAPQRTIVGSAGSGDYLYMVVKHGMTGTTYPAGNIQVHDAPNVLDGTNYVHLTAPSDPDAFSWDWLRAPISDTDDWELIGTSTTNSFDDQGGTTTRYFVPTVNTTNMGIGGVDLEDDVPYRARIPLALAESARSTTAALSEAVGAIVGVRQAFVTDAVVGGTPPPGTATMQIVGTTPPIPTGDLGDLGSQIDAVIAATKAAGIIVTWTELTPNVLHVNYTLTVLLGTAAQIGAALSDANMAIVDYFTTLSPGDPARFSQIIQAILNAVDANATVATTGAKAAVTALTLVNGATTYTMADAPATPGVLWSTESADITATVTGG